MASRPPRFIPDWSALAKQPVEVGPLPGGQLQRLDVGGAAHALAQDLGQFEALRGRQAQQDADIHVHEGHATPRPSGPTRRHIPPDFIARLAALLPKPRVHRTRHHGVFAPHSRWRSQITPAGRGSRRPETDTRTPAERPRAMAWGQRLKRVFQQDLETCEGCGGGRCGWRRASRTRWPALAGYIARLAARFRWAAVLAEEEAALAAAQVRRQTT